MDNQKQAKFLKKAKREVFWHCLLKCPIPKEYHKAIVRLECCSMSVLCSYIKFHTLSSSAGVLFFNLYAESHPELVSLYLKGRYVDRCLSCRVIESKNLDFIKLVNTYSFKDEAQLALVKLNDAEYFREVINLVSFTDYSSHAVETLIALMNVGMFACDWI